MDILFHIIWGISSHGIYIRFSLTIEIRISGWSYRIPWYPCMIEKVRKNMVKLSKSRTNKRVHTLTFLFPIEKLHKIILKIMILYKLDPIHQSVSRYKPLNCVNFIENVWSSGNIPSLKITFSILYGTSGTNTIIQDQYQYNQINEISRGVQIYWRKNQISEE